MPNRKKLLFSGVLSAALLLLGLMLAWITLCSLGDIFGGLSSLIGEDTAKMLSDIFSQTKQAKIGLHVLLPLVAAGLLFAACFYSKSTCGSRVLTIIAALLIFLLIYVAALLLSRVNDIRFFDLVRSLIGSVNEGLFDSV